MKKGQNKNYQAPPFNSGLGGKVSYDQLLTSLRQKSQAEKKALTICKKRKK